MLQVDFHVHSSFSRCGVHSVLEILNYAKNIGMKGIAITDHGRELKSTVPSPFWDRFVNPIDEIRLLKGIESNIKNEKGDIDVPFEYMKFIDVILIGLHVNLPVKLGKKKYTGLLLKALKKNPYIDIVCHPNDENFPVDIEQIAGFAAENGLAVELNNSKTLLRRIHDESTLALLEACKKAKCLMAINSDAHAILEIGRDESAQQMIKKADFPVELIVNRNAQTAFEFIEKRKAFKSG